MSSTTASQTDFDDLVVNLHFHKHTLRSKFDDSNPDGTKRAIDSYVYGVMRDSIIFVLRAGLDKHRLIDALSFGGAENAKELSMEVQAEIERRFDSMHEFLDQPGVDIEHPSTAAHLASTYQGILELKSPSAMDK
ncbi:hypothetical protein A1Q2_01331 [Trichosporon asahii var. asahii CBS 8904]|uniref:Uncharacterized protein n=1 Tax=Trichosporon asahii var. asahii (strain CBS 8904) TaxID=1220162 RepID=K1VJJ2_TRIAC|nr:hypothetical protein A1Q2_01331 [Trichosporon asahii var. asahii CBS 8904]